jgi:serine phosphatase RsbU (regulator of sigma subunit)
VAELNRLVCNLCPNDFYATIFYARIYPGKSSFTYVNAGHESALLLRPDARRVFRLNAGGTVLGLTSHAKYEQAAIFYWHTRTESPKRGVGPMASRLISGPTRILAYAIW